MADIIVKTGVILDDKGNIAAIIQQDNLNPNNYSNFVDITNHKNKDLIKKNPKDYKVVKGKITTK